MLDMPRAFHDDFATEVSLSYNFWRIDYAPPTGADSRHDQHNLNAINRWSWFPSERLTLRSGADYRFIFLDSTEIGIRDRHDGGIYLAAEYSPVKRLMFIPSVKAVFTSGSAADTAAIPKLGILWNVTDSAHPAGALAVKNNYFRSFKFPDFEELYWTGAGGIGNTGGNPDLLPEDGWGGDIGAEWQVNNYVKLESVFFTQWIKNSIHWYSGNSGSWRPENVGEAIFFGLDNKLGFEIPISRGPFKKIVPSLSYKYLRSYLLSFGYTVNSNKRIPYNPEHTIGASLDFIWGNSAASSGSFLITGYYESLRYNDRANNTALNPYFLLNATVNQKAGKNLTVFGTLRNILNTSYESFYGYPMPGITLTLGMRVNLDVNKAEKTPENFSRGDAEAQRTQRGKQ
jgi:outer membrane receptor protein involved in Fe transport